MQTGSGFIRATLAALLISLAGPVLSAEPIESRIDLGARELNDQHDRSHRLRDCSRLILFAPDRDSSKLVKAVFGDTDAATLEERGICYIADISTMPGMITRMFALPAMREYPYPVLLGRESVDTGFLPRKNGKVTVLEIDAERIEAFGFVGDADRLSDIVAAPTAAVSE